MSAENEADLLLALSRDGRRATLEVRPDDLTLDMLDDFDAACRKLLATGRRELVIDLSRLTRIHSGFIGMVLFVNSEAVGRGLSMFMVAGGKIKASFEQIAPGLVDIRGSA
jgi:hypothetical protein